MESVEKIKLLNYIEMKILALSVNEQFARNAVASFSASLNPTLEEISDIKTAVSEAVTNSVVHGYGNSGEGEIFIKVSAFENCIVIDVADFGVGIVDIECARKPFYTTKEEDERAGMGFTVMEAVMDKVEIVHNNPSGLRVTLTKRIG